MPEELMLEDIHKKDSVEDGKDTPIQRTISVLPPIDLPPSPLALPSLSQKHQKRRRIEMVVRGIFPIACQVSNH